MMQVTARNCIVGDTNSWRCPNDYCRYRLEAIEILVRPV